jgi:hypothetical protein
LGLVNRSRIVGHILIGALACAGAASQGEDVNAELRAELLRRTERDQAARRAAAAVRREASVIRREADTEQPPFAAVDADNLPWLRQVIAEFGWPGRSLVGTDGAHAAWLLAQHADADPAFQRQCLDRLAPAAAAGEATAVELAYLTDRVLLAEGRPQEYGTQATARDGRWVPRRLRDPDAVDERRAAVSLGPIAGYLDRIAADYGPPRPAVLPCRQCGTDIEFWLPDGSEEQQVRCDQCGRTVTIRSPAAPLEPATARDTPAREPET